MNGHHPFPSNLAPVNGSPAYMLLCGYGLASRLDFILGSHSPASVAWCVSRAERLYSRVKGVVGARVSQIQL